ncbi:MAG: hypothetical protein Q9195_009368 [Heterodermia aff. obscurata]
MSLISALGKCSFLARSGVTAVKTDVQFLLDQLDSAKDRRVLILTYQDAWLKAVLGHLEGRAISCMSQMPQILFRYQLPPDKPTFAVRNSDDFYPDEPTAHSWHVFCNAHNAVLSQNLKIVPDRDMFQTNHAYSGFHAAARCVSGGMIYFTDVPGSHDLNILNQISATTPERTIILRPAVGRATEVYIAHNEPALCKIRSSHNIGNFMIDILGVFTTSKTLRSEFLTLDDILGNSLERGYLIRSYQSRSYQKVIPSKDQLPPVLLDLAFWGWDNLAAYPLQSFHEFHLSSEKKDMDIAILGFIQKLTGAAALTKVEISLDDDGPQTSLRIGVKAPGTHGIYISDLQDRHIGENVMVCERQLRDSSILMQKNNQLLEIDLSAAWERTHGSSEWEGELLLSFSIH